jgi:hypothetical protein
MAARAFAAGFLVLWVVSGAFGQAPPPASPSPPASPIDQYEQKRKAIDPNSADDHYGLGEWAFRNGLTQKALEELKAALAISPGHVRASILIQEVQRRLGVGPATQGTRPAPEANAVGAVLPREWLAPEEDIFRIRMEELRPEERLPIQFRNDVINRFIKKWRGKEEFKEFRFEDAFRGWVQANPARAVEFMREKDPEDTDIKDDILVQNDPKFMTDFRAKVWPIVAASCAAPQCHGGGEPKGGLRLFNVAGRNERIDYTNYLLVDGVVSRGRRMVDRANPEVSLLLQYMLPEDLAQFRHSTKIQAAAGRKEDARYVAVLEWIQSLHRPPHPDYRLKYAPPMGMKLVHKAEVNLPPPGPSTPSTTPARP